MKTTWRMLGNKLVGGKWQFDAELAKRDMEQLEGIHRLQCEIYGKNLVGDFPNPLEKPVVISLVAERDGKIVDGAIGEAIIEWCHIGCDARAAVSLSKKAFGLIAFLKKRGFRLIRTFVPSEVAEPVGKELERTGFVKQDAYSSFLLDIR